MIAGVNTETTRAEWTTVPGRSIQQTYNANGDPVTITYLSNGTAVFIQNLTYDANGNCTEIECVAP